MEVACRHVPAYRQTHKLYQNQLVRYSLTAFSVGCVRTRQGVTGFVWVIGESSQRWLCEGIKSFLYRFAAAQGQAVGAFCRVGSEAVGGSAG